MLQACAQKRCGLESASTFALRTMKLPPLPMVALLGAGFSTVRGRAASTKVAIGHKDPTVTTERDTSDKVSSGTLAITKRRFGNLRMKWLLLGLALYLGCVHPTSAIEVKGGRGERDHVHGIVTRVDAHSITIKWMADPTMTTRALSHEQTYIITPSTQYRNGTFASLAKGAEVRIWGHGFTADAIQIAKP
jgi:hypothetical protein